MQHDKKISDQVRARAQREDIEWRRKVKLAGWFANFNEFSHVVQSGRVEAAVVQRTEFVLYL